jgi:hypothetical protein
MYTEIKAAVERWQLNITILIKLYVGWVEMVIYIYISGQIKSTCKKDDEANILTPLPGDRGNQ